MNENEHKDPVSFVDAMIKASGLIDLTDHETLLLYLENAKTDLENILHHWNEALIRWNETPDECDPLECTRNECIGWVNGLQIGKMYLTLMEYKPTFLETTERKIHNAKALKDLKAKKRRKRKSNNKAKNDPKNKSK